MEPTLVILARHGESDWNATGRFQGRADRPLTPGGRRQAEELAARLARVSLDAVFASELQRALETARIVARSHELEVETVSALNEIDVGSWSGLTRAEAEQRFPAGYGRWLARGVGWDDGETYAQLADRAIGAVRRLAARHEGGRILIVTHGGVLRALLASATGVSVAAIRRQHPVTRNAGLHVILVDSSGRLSETPDHDLD
jgi:2,3-bisphosphoglycerate-dependent phosphoglycerate mutase